MNTNTNAALKTDDGFRDILLPVPYDSQLRDVAFFNEPRRACGMCCVHMTLAYYQDLGLLRNTRDPKLPAPPLESLDELIAFGRERDGLVDGIGWQHEYLANVIREHGIHCDRPPAYKLDDEEAIPFFGKVIGTYRDPILVSRHYTTRSGTQSTHLILLTGVQFGPGSEVTGFFYHDSDVEEPGAGEHVPISVEEFLRVWRRLALLPCTKDRNRID